MLESTSGSIRIMSISANVFEQVIEFIYTGKCNVQQSQVSPMLQAAARLQVIKLLPRMENIAVDSVSVETSFDIWDISPRIPCTM